MKRHAIRVAWMRLLAGPWTPASALHKRAVPGVATGGVKCSAHQIGMDASALVKPHDIDLTVLPSRGSGVDGFPAQCLSLCPQPHAAAPSTAKRSCAGKGVQPGGRSHPDGIWPLADRNGNEHV